MSQPGLLKKCHVSNGDLKGDKDLDRLKKLLQWKQEKKKRQETEQRNKKAVFKVRRLSNHYNPNLSKIYGEIKGKPIANKTQKRPSIETDNKQTRVQVTKKICNKNKVDLNKVLKSKKTEDCKNQALSLPKKKTCSNLKSVSPIVQKNVKRIKQLYNTATLSPVNGFNFWKPYHTSTPLPMNQIKKKL